MKIENWMTEDFPAVRSSDTVSRALEVMKEYGYTEAVVLDEDGKFLGVVNKDDIDEAPKDKSVGDYASLPDFYVCPGSGIESALLAFMEYHEDFVPVVDEDMKVVGIVSLQDILESMIEITAMDEPGTRISISLPDVPGALKRVVDALAESKMNILSVLTYREDGRRRVVIRVDVKDAEAVAGVLKDYGIEYDEVEEEEGF